MPRGGWAGRVAGAAGPVLAVLCIVGLDLVMSARHRSVVVTGLLDEPAHLLTAWLALVAVGATSPRVWPWVLAGAVAIDVDHLPMYLWNEPLNADGGRPITHSLTTVLVLLAVALGARRVRTAAVGIAAGVLLHLVRDVATGPGVSLLWPLRDTNLSVPYWAYLAVVGLLAGAAVLRQWRRADVRRLREG
ncbi:metal-dependent hydrolase [Geodermatophilus sp. SYSU D01045]